MTEFEKWYRESSIMTIAPLLYIDREKIGDMRILQELNDGVYVCTCRVYSDAFKNYTSHEFVYDSYFLQL